MKRPPIPYARQSISDQDIEAVRDVLKSDFLTQGPEVERFEALLCDATESRYAVAVSSATAALHLAMLAMGTEDPGLVWTSPNTFVATSNAALYCRAKVNFIDIDLGTLNISADALETRLREAELLGALPTMVVPVHFGGVRPEMERIWELSKRYGFRVLEDASHALGSLYQGRPLAKDSKSDAMVLSFHAIKNVTTGEGGAVITDDPDIDERVRALRTHGVTRDPNRMIRPSEGPWYYEQQALGFNYRMTDIQAALGSSQLGRLSKFIEKRNEIARFYNEQFADLPIRTQVVPSGCRSAYHLFVAWIDGPSASDRRRRWFEFLRASGIGVNVHYIPVYEQPYYRDQGPFFPCPNMDRYYAGTLTLPMHTNLDQAQLESIVLKVREGLASIL